MKNKLIIVISVILIAAIVGTVGFVAYKAGLKDSNTDEKAQPKATESAVKSTAPAATQYSETFKIGIVQNGLGTASQNCYDGFIYELDDRGLSGNITIEHVAEEDEELCRQKIQGLIDGGCDLLYTIGRFASEEAAKITTDVPIVFGAVTSPDKIGLVESNKIPGGNVTGVSSYTPCFEQIDLIPLLMPSAHSVAVMYTGTDENAVSQGIAASTWAERIGLTATQYIIEDKASMKTSLGKVKSTKADVIYIPTDKFLSKNIASIVKFSQENKIPIICGDEATLAQGAFATSEINYTSIGRKAAGMAVDILFEGKDIKTFPVMYKHDCTNLVNKATRDKLGIEIPATALGEVEIWTATAEATSNDPSTAPKPTTAATEASQ